MTLLAGPLCCPDACPAASASPSTARLVDFDALCLTPIEAGRRRGRRHDAAAQRVPARRPVGGGAILAPPRASLLLCGDYAAADLTWRSAAALPFARLARTACARRRRQ